MEPRTSQQNKALHAFFRLVSEALNNAGLDIRTTLKPDFHLEWTPILVKELLWKETQKIMLGKQSTTELSKQEDIEMIYNVINRFLGEKHGIHVPFPSIENE